MIASSGTALQLAHTAAARARASCSSSRATRAACSRSTSLSVAPLSMIARWKSPFADGIASSVATLRPPPDWPKTVTLPASPPNSRDVVAHPLERVHDVEHADVAGLRELAAAELRRDT